MINRLGPKLEKVAGIKLYMQPVQDLTVDDRVSRTEYQYTLEDPNQDELNTVVHELVAKLKKLPRAGGRGRPISNWADCASRWSSTAPRLRASASRRQTIDNTLYDAFGQRQINTIYTQLNQYHVILEADPQFQLNPRKLNDIYIQSSSTSGTRSPRRPRTRRDRPRERARDAASPATRC